MSKRTLIETVDDLTGKVIPEVEAETVRFGFDGRDYEFDTNAKGKADFAKDLKKYLDVAMPVGRTTNRVGKRTTLPPARDTKAIREWAHENGHPAPDRGRIPFATIEAYENRDKAAEKPADKPKAKPAKAADKPDDGLFKAAAS